MRKIAYLGMIPMLAFMVFACQKNDLSSPSLTADAKGGGGGPVTVPAFVYTQPTFDVACETDASYCFNVSVEKKNGGAPGGDNNSITVTVFNADGVTQATTTSANPFVINGTSGEVCITGLVAGQYKVQVYYRHANNDNAAVNVPLTFDLTVQSSASCGGSGTPVCTADGVSLTRSSSVLEADNTGRIVNVTSTYTVHNCSDNLITRLKLQGGLVNKASLTSQATSGDSPNATSSHKTTGGNTVLSWTFDLPSGGTQIFTVSYTVNGTSCNSPISGAWSLKNSAGIPIGVASEDESATQTGYLDRLYWNCP